MKTNYKEIALQMNRLYCIGEGHVASDLLLDAIKNDNASEKDSQAPTSDYTDYLLNELDRIQKELAAVITEIAKWTKQTEVQS
jgi:hypothetical protein